MKRVLLLFFALALGLGVKAQCHITTAVDFTATDCHGTEVHLFDILDGGQYVLIDFFFTTCGPCQQATPKVVESYYTMGCNMHDVFYMEISDRDSDAACQNWVTTYGVEYPTISGAAGGNTISNQYQIEAFPTLILIAPDRSIVIQDLWPINNAQTVVNALVAQGPQPHDCNASTDIMPDFTAPDIDGNEIHLYDILDGGQAVLINFFLYGDEFSENIMQDMVEAYHLYGCNAHDVFFMEITPNGHDDDCQAWVEEFGVQYPTISRDGGGNDIAQAIPVALYPDIMLIRPDHTIAQRDIYPPTLEYIIDAMEAEGYEQYPCYDETLTFNMNTIYVNAMEVAWITVYNNTNEEAHVNNVDDEWGLLFTLDGQTMYGINDPLEFTIPQGGSIELGLYLDQIAKEAIQDVVTLSSNLPDASFVAMVNLPVSVEENKTSITLFPSPANERVTIKGLIHGTLSVYNTLGQKVEEFIAEGSELTINTAKYENGVYVVKSDNGTIARFIVKH